MVERNAESMGSFGATWEYGGYAGGGNVAALIGSLRGRPAIVAGGARGVFEEVAAAEEKLGPESVVFAANDVGMYLPRLDHWISLHTKHLAAWKAVRWLHPVGHETTRYHGIEPYPFTDYTWERLTPLFALSGSFAMQIAWIMGASPIVLCGCPGDSTPRFFERTAHFPYGGPHARDDGVREQLVSEMRRVPAFKAAVRSMSGWTGEFFGGL